MDFEKTSATVEGLFPLIKNNEVGDTGTAVLGVSVVLKKEETEKSLPKEPDLSPVVSKAPQTLQGHVDFKRTVPRTDRGARDNLSNVMMKHEDVNSKVKTPEKHKERNLNIKVTLFSQDFSLQDRFFFFCITFSGVNGRTFHTPFLIAAQKMKCFIKDFFSKCDRIRKNSIFVQLIFL